MPPHNRPNGPGQGGFQGIPRAPMGGPAPGIDSMLRDVRALNSSILIITQKMKFLVRNEKILGRNVLVLNKKIQGLVEKGDVASAAGGASALELQGLTDRFSSELAKLDERAAFLETELERVKETYAKLDQVQEMKYVVDSINPLEFVTYQGLDKILDERLAGLKEKADAQRKSR